ncbi:MAG: domain S-box protein [Chitinophagaceae bacterium]|nr:domain S-box protein [Chitinophagaceae bacterium]
MYKNENYFPLNNIDNIHQFKALFDFATIGIIVTDKHGLIINFNKYAETQFGFSKDEIIGKVVDVLLPTSAHARHVQYREQYYKHPEPRIMGHGRDLFAQNKDGSTFPVEVSLSHYEIKEQTFVIAFVIDITVRKSHEAKAMEQTYELERVTAEIKSMNQELEQKVEDRTKMLREALTELEKSKEELNLAFENEKELSELKSRFSTMASHEFRTPLSTILSSAFLLERYNQPSADGKVEKHIHRIKGAVEGMKNMLEDFLSLGKLEEGLVKANMELIGTSSLNAILKELLEELDGLLKDGQRIEFTFLVNKAVWIDRHFLKNIVINLVSNSIKFTDESGVIKISSTIDNNDFILSVEDNGIGISEEDQQHSFERFFRAKNASNIEGTGLGLHIVSKYCELMQGSVKMKSTLDHGTTVSIYIPQLTAE